nr:phospholipase-like protein [Tanacetum cinerariifolium]
EVLCGCCLASQLMIHAVVIDFLILRKFPFYDKGYDTGEVKFVSRVLPKKVGDKVTNLDLLGVIEDEELMGNLCDEDAVRVCLLLLLEVIFKGRLLVDVVDDSHMRLVENIEEWNVFP